MTFNERVIELANLVGADIGDLISTTGSLTALDTAEKINLVAAINEVHSKLYVADISLAENNIIKQKLDGLFAEIDTPADISSFTAALDAALI